MPMQHYKVILGPQAMKSVNAVVDFIKSVYTEESAQKYRKSILYELESLSYYASIFPLSKFHLAQTIHPEAKTLSIMKRRWTVVFHIDGEYVIVDRILPSRMMTE